MSWQKWALCALFLLQFIAALTQARRLTVGVALFSVLLYGSMATLAVTA